jgi:hypothetical protein
MREIIDGVLYNTDDANLIAYDHKYDRYLYKSQQGVFFLHHTTLFEEERERIEPIPDWQARQWYDKMDDHEMEWHDAFNEEPEWGEY